MPITANDPPGASEIGWPKTVINPPGVKVLPSMTNWEAELAVYVDLSKVRTAGPAAGEIGADVIND